MRRLTLALAGAAALAAAGCGGGEKKSQSTEPKELQIQVIGGKLQVPASVQAGAVKIRFTNSEKADHEAQLARLEGNHTVDQAVKAISRAERSGIPGWIVGGGGVGTTRGGASQSVTQQLEPGKYAVLDMEGDKPLTAEFEVTSPALQAKLPGTKASVTASEYAFASSGLKSGKTQVLFKNTGKELHHVIALRMRSGATIEQVKRFFETEKGQPPVEEQGGDSTAVIDTGREQVVELDLKKGKYALACFITDRKGGPPHVAKGMVSEAEVR